MLAFTTPLLPVLRSSPRLALSPRLTLSPRRALSRPPSARLTWRVSPTSSSPPPAIFEDIAAAAAGNAVFLATKTRCPYCVEALALLDAVGADPEVWDLSERDDGYEIQDALEKVTGQRTVPNIFIGGKHVGGCSELMKLEAKGVLGEMIKGAAL